MPKWSVLFLLLLAGLSGAQAQTAVIERNLPPDVPRLGGAVRINPDQLMPDDPTPLGADLRAIVLVGAKDAAVRSATPGIAVKTDVLNADAIRGALAGYLGQPISRRLITGIQGAISDIYRSAGRPFVSVTLPPQEITRGVLTVRVVEARLSGVKVEGASDSSYVAARVRATPNAPIDARKLDADLDWLNRNPFRRTEAVFGPGKDLAESELTLRVIESKPWQVFGGYANSGTRLTGRDRYFAGGIAALPGDIVASAQLTGSRDFWRNDGRIFDTAMGGYYSPAGRLVVPVGYRSSVELVGDYVQTNERPVDPFRIRTRTAEGSIIYRSAVSNIITPAFGDWMIGADVKRVDRLTLFAETPTAQGRGDVAQWFGGWAGRWDDRYGVNSLDIRIKNNPGGLLPGNSSADWNTFTNGRVDDIHATFATVQFERKTPLPYGVSLLTEFSGLLSGKSLPDTERYGFGGFQSVRGYVTEDGVGDRALVVRNSLYAPPVALNVDKLAAPLQPYGFVDYGWGKDLFTSQKFTLASLGAGFEQQLGAYFRSNVLAAYALRDGAYTPTGAWRVQLRLTAAY